MKPHTATRYKFFPSEPATLVELYLPKKARLQGTLYETLTNGFHNDALKKHFKDRNKTERIRHYLVDYPRLSASYGNMLESFPRILYGYSMYEVDGVFLSSRPRGGESPVVEERTQVIRLIFTPDFEFIYSHFMKEGAEEESASDEAETLKAQIRRLAKSYLAFPVSNIDQFKASMDYADHRIDPANLKYCSFDEEGLLRHLEVWGDYITLFLFGYLIYEICEKIESLYASEGADPEEEIWVTSQWNMVMNRIRR